MPRTLAILGGFAAFASMVGTAAGQGPVFSGPQAGEKLTPFKVHVVGGANAGKQVELISDGKDTPRVLVFVHDFTRPSLQLLKPVDEYTNKLASEGLETHLVWLTSDVAKSDQYLSGAIKSLSLTGRVVISVDGVEGPGNYGLNRKMTMTILVAKGTKVVDNFAIVQPNETDAPKVTAAIAKLMGKTPPTLQELQGKNKPPPARDKAKIAPSPELQALMRKMIQMTNDEAAVSAVVDEMRRWAGEDRMRRVELQSYCKMILELGYGTEACKKALAELAGK